MAESGDLPPHLCGRQFPGRQLSPYAGLYPAVPCGRHPVGQQAIYEYKAPDGYRQGRRYCWFTLFTPRSENQLKKFLMLPQITMTEKSIVKGYLDMN